MKNTNRNNRGPRLRQNDGTQNAKRARAIHHCRFVHLARNGEKKLAQEKNIVRVCKKCRNEQRQPSANPTEFHIERVRRNERDRFGQKDGRDDDGEQQLFARNAKARKAIRDKNIGKQYANCTQHGERNRIKHQARIIKQIPHLFIIGKRRRKFPRAVEGTPRAFPHKRRRGQIRGVEKFTRRASFFVQRQFAHSFRERHFIDFVLFTFKRYHARFRGIQRRAEFRHLRRRLERIERDA